MTSLEPPFVPPAPPPRQPQVNDPPESAQAAGTEAQQIQQSMMVMNNQMQQLAARLVYLEGWLGGNANRENRRASAKQARAAPKKKPAKTTARKLGPRTAS